MELKEAVLILKQHQEWRRGCEHTVMINPTALGNAIDIILKELNKKT